MSAEPGMRGTRLRQALPHDSSTQVGGRRFSVGYDSAGAPAFSTTRSESCLLAGSSILARTSCRNTSSCPVA
jgi:hypothetical protein